MHQLTTYICIWICSFRGENFKVSVNQKQILSLAELYLFCLIMFKRVIFVEHFSNTICTELYLATLLKHLHMEYIYIYQLVRYSRMCGSSHDFLAVTRKLLDQRIIVTKLKSSIQNHHDLINHCGKSVSHMTMDMFHLSQSHPVISSCINYH